MKVVTVLLCLSVAMTACSSPPSDATLLAEFRIHRADFQRLLQMFQRDSALGRIAYDFTRPSNFFSGKPVRTTRVVTPQVLNEYHQLFDELHLTGGIEGYGEKHVIMMWRYSEGFGAGLGGSSRGFAYSDSLSSNQIHRDGCETRTSDCWSLRPIGGGWFLLDESHN
jgi:hypothetical protein